MACEIWTATPTMFRLSAHSIDLQGHLRCERVIFYLNRICIKVPLLPLFPTHLFIYSNQTTASVSLTHHVAC